jgi:hypothetical protein
LIGIWTTSKSFQAEEKEVVLSDFCGPREWMPMRKLHTEVFHGKHTYFLSRFYAEAKLYYVNPD